LAWANGRLYDALSLAQEAQYQIASPYLQEVRQKAMFFTTSKPIQANLENRGHYSSGRFPDNALLARYKDSYV
jgi:hypothetical protein